MQVFVKQNNEILHLETTVGNIATTTNHPFYVIDKGWVAARDLTVGDEVYIIDGSSGFVTGLEIEKFAEPLVVYNLEVEGFHSYFVGDGVLVHNAYKPVKDGTYSAEIKPRETEFEEPHAHIYQGGKPVGRFFGKGWNDPSLNANTKVMKEFIDIQVLFKKHY